MFLNTAKRTTTINHVVLAVMPVNAPYTFLLVSLATSVQTIYMIAGMNKAL